MKTDLFWIACPLAGVLLLSSCSSGTEPNNAMADHVAMMKADSAAKGAVASQEATVKAVFDAFNNGKMNELDNVMTENFVEHQSMPEITTTGRQGAKDMMAMVRTAYPDYKQEIVSMSTSGDRTYVHFRMTGTNTGPWGEMPATDKAMDVMGVDVLRFENGKAAEHWGYMEEMKMMQQLGLMPAMGTEPGKK
jgi:steroid delta-isomerase-like uncharacterized protein